MKLRNKKTGKIKEFNAIYEEKDTVKSENIECTYCKIDELNAEWEDYEPQEPLIKDEKIRKAVMAWADRNYITEVNVNVPTYDSAILSLSWGMLGIEFIDDKEDLIDGGTYTITELCGESDNA